MERHLYAYEYVRLAFDDIRGLLQREPTAILQAATEKASGHAREILATLHVPLGGFELSRDVAVSVGELVDLGADQARLPLTWQSSSREGLFPSMRADLEIAALSVSEPRSQVSIVGAYVPPAGVIGAVGDSLGALHRLAEASVYRLVRDIASHLEEELGA